MSSEWLSYHYFRDNVDIIHAFCYEETAAGLASPSVTSVTRMFASADTRAKIIIQIETCMRLFEPMAKYLANFSDISPLTRAHLVDGLTSRLIEDVTCLDGGEDVPLLFNKWKDNLLHEINR